MYQEHLSLNWTTIFKVDHEEDGPVTLLVKIFDEVLKCEDIPMGPAVFKLGAILSAKDHTCAKKMDKDKVHL